MMVKKLTMVLLAGALALPVAGFAVEQGVDAPKAAVAAPKPVIATPADCVVTGKNKGPVKGAAATEKRKQIHARKGIVSGEEKLVVHDKQAAHDHGKHSEN
ncbi:MAG: hypothetical protein WCK54_07620 [Desulfuromonadales bacterium]